MEKIKWCLNTMPKSDKEKSIEILTEKEVVKADPKKVLEELEKAGKERWNG